MLSVYETHKVSACAILIPKNAGNVAQILRFSIEWEKKIWQVYEILIKMFLSKVLHSREASC